MRISYKKPKNLLVKPYVIHVPKEQRINTIIACCGWVYSTVFNISKYGLRPHEISKLTLRNIDLEKGNLTVPTARIAENHSAKKTNDRITERIR